MARDADPPLGRGSALAARVRRLARSVRAREVEGLFLAEGIHLADEAIRRGAPLVDAILSPRLLRDPRGREIRARLRALGVPLHQTSDRLMDSLQDAGTHQGILLVAARPVTAAEFIPSGASPATLLVTAGVQDPGNAGALVRVADAAGAAGILCAGGADPWGPKAVRASAGSIFRLPVQRIANEAALPAGISRLTDSGVTAIAAVPRGGLDYRDLPYDGATALVVGGEGGGLADDVISACSASVTIPLQHGVESINVTCAAALLLFEAARRAHPAS